MGERIQISETGLVARGGRSITASTIWERHAIGEPDTPVVMRAQIGVDDEPSQDLAVGDTLAIGEETWRVEEILEDPVNRRGHVVLERVD